MRRFLLLLPLCVVTGCSSLDISELFPKSEETKTVYRPGGNAIRAFALSGTGSVEYMCTSDEKGTFYKFINMDIVLKDKTRRTVGTILGKEQKIEYVDGSVISSLEPVQWGPSESLHRNDSTLNDVLFVAHSSNSQNRSKALTNIKYVTRSHTRGGLPKKLCNGESVGKNIEVPIYAEFIFWKVK